MGNVLVACEVTQVVADAFRQFNHNAYSCDINPCYNDSGRSYHIQDDALNLIHDPFWDAVIAFPPCTDLASSGAKHFAQKRADGRQQRAIEFFLEFTRINAKWCIENPVGIMSSQFRKPDQIIHPYFFGDPFKKRTCLWLNGFPLLEKTNVVDTKEDVTLSSGRKMSAWYYETSCKTNSLRGEIRSMLSPAIAYEMARQWSEYI